ncbi:hypothetical protein T459_01834 [Capsicum annuum]|uniref:Uncharacterized protein n=1 Tax=Capsicum annuum TaxID=4072 RepID=A0A2G3AI91_CAPAN|nr:hypothetical protein FXO37_12949 [Capsicum annuum]PHT93952.1 hypothetical protein T459_01834 [Capsicum annuum]
MLSSLGSSWMLQLPASVASNVRHRYIGLEGKSVNYSVVFGVFTLGDFFPYSQAPMDKVIRYPVENSQLSNVSPLKRPFHSLKVMFIVSSRSDSSLHPPCKNTSKTYTQTEKRKDIINKQLLRCTLELARGQSSKRVQELNKVRAQAALASHVISAAIPDDGSLWLWGSSKCRQLDFGKYYCLEFSFFPECSCQFIWYWQMADLIGLGSCSRAN